MSTVDILNFIKSHRYAQHEMRRPTVTDVAWSVPECIGWSYSVSCAKTDRDAVWSVELRGK